MVRKRARSMLAAPQFNDPKYWHQRAEEARAMAKQMSSELSKKMMLKVAEVCDRFAIGAAMCSIYEFALSSRQTRTAPCSMPSFWRKSMSI